MLCFGKEVDEENFSYSFFTSPEIILGTTNLTNQQKILYRRRFMKKLYSVRKLKHYFAIMYYVQKFLSTTLGVAIPALLSIQYYYDNGLDNPIYWSAWALSLFGGFVSGYGNIFKVDDRFFLLKTIYQKMKFEGWSFLLLCKKYDMKMENGEKMKHNQLFTMFMESIEQIIDDYKRSDMAAIMEVSNKSEEEVLEMQQRAMSEPQNEQLHSENERENMEIVGQHIENNRLNLPNLHVSPETQELQMRFKDVMSKRPYIGGQV